MSKTYLFFDIECANCFNNEGKICSFGYALCDSDFKIIKSEDIIINPNSEFDPYLFRKDSKCRLSYPREEFAKHPDFNEFYETIKNLLTAKDCTVFGFGVDNDVVFIVSECIRYRYDIIDFACYDIHKLAVSMCGTSGSLDTWVDYFGIDKSALQMHRSSDDALATLLVAQKLCEKENITIEQLIEKSSGKITSSFAFESYKKSLYRNLYKARIAHCMNSKPEASDLALSGKTFCLVLSKNTDIAVRYELVKDITDNGARLTDSCTTDCIILCVNPREKPSWIKKNNNKIMYLDDVYLLIGKKVPKIYSQKTLPADFDYKKARKELLRY